MPNHSAAIVQKLWNYCDVLRDAGLSYGDYVEQLTFLLFLKMAHEQTQPPWNRPSPVPPPTPQPACSPGPSRLWLVEPSAGCPGGSDRGELS